VTSASTRLQPNLLRTALATLLALALAGAAVAADVPPAPGASGATPAKPKAKVPEWLAQMDFGPVIADTVIAADDNIAIKGYAVRLEGNGADGAPVLGGMCFDADLLRMSAGWTGGYLDLKGDAYDGSHSPGPRTAGRPVFATRPTPGWAAKDGGFADPRHEPYGPLPAGWAKYKGCYVHGAQAVLSYSVGAGAVLELPGMEPGGAALSRTFHLAGMAAATMVVAELPGAAARVEGGIAVLAADQHLVWAGLVGAPAGVALAAADGRIVMTVPALKSAVFKLVIGNADPAKAAALVAAAAPAADPEPLTRGGAPRWPTPVETVGALGDAPGQAAPDAAYVVDTITAPYENPYHCQMRFGGFDFFADGRAAISTWNGDVWIVSGIDAGLGKLSWKRFAAGLHHPLGLKVVDDTVYALCRDGLFRVRDLDHDGEADFYECFNNDVHTTSAFHEFAFDLWTDAKGDFYFAKAGPVKKGGRGFETIADHHGCLLKISKDGSKLEVVATGFRAPNGISVGPHGELTSGDNEGTWTPTSRINLIEPGGFYGVPDLAHREPRPVACDPPLCWLPHGVDNSCGGQAWVTSDRWGPLEGRLLHLSYGTCSLFLVAWSKQDGVAQGGCTRFPLGFNSGSMRARFNARDGQLYVSGLKGWQTTAANGGGFQRVRYTGKPVTMPAEMAVRKNGISLTFSGALDRAAATDKDNFAAEQWNYLWTEAYGSPEVMPSDPKKTGHEPVVIASTTLSADGKTLFLEIPALQPVMQLKLKYRLKSAAGAPVEQEFYATVNKLGTASGP
jgi:glucose/arabinose dehydrogenase